MVKLNARLVCVFCDVRYSLTYPPPFDCRMICPGAREDAPGKVLDA